MRLKFANSLQDFDEFVKKRRRLQKYKRTNRDGGNAQSFDFIDRPNDSAVQAWGSLGGNRESSFFFPFFFLVGSLIP
jgi:hypothetical protein